MSSDTELETFSDSQDEVKSSSVVIDPGVDLSDITDASLPAGVVTDEEPAVTVPTVTETKVVMRGEKEVTIVNDEEEVDEEEEDEEEEEGEDEEEESREHAEQKEDRRVKRELEKRGLLIILKDLEQTFREECAGILTNIDLTMKTNKELQTLIDSLTALIQRKDSKEGIYCAYYGALKIGESLAVRAGMLDLVGFSDFTLESKLVDRPLRLFAILSAPTNKMDPSFVLAMSTIAAVHVYRQRCSRNSKKCDVPSDLSSDISDL